MMLFEYLEHRNGVDAKKKIRKVLSRYEGHIFGLDTRKTGWANCDIELSSDQVASAIRYVQKAENLKQKVKQRINKISVVNEEFGTKKLYLMQNSKGLFKIGISIDPSRRARHLTNASGYAIGVVGAWCMFDAMKEERNLHKIFKRYRKNGEWFDKSDLTVEEIEGNLTQEFRRLVVLTQEQI